MHDPDGEEEGRRSRGQGQQHAFGQQLAHQAGAAGAERKTDGDFLAPVGRAGQHHVADIGAGDQQQQATQHQHELPEERAVLLPQRQYLSACHQQHARPLLVSIRIAVERRQLLCRGIELRLRGGVGYARPQAPDHLKHGEIAPFQSVVVQFRRDLRARGDGQPQVRRKQRRRCAQKLFGADADYGAGMPVDADRLADGRRVGAQALFPESVADDYGRRLARPGIGVVEGASQTRPHTQCGEVRRRDQMAPSPFGASILQNPERDRRHIGEGAGEQIVQLAVALVRGIGDRCLQSYQFAWVRNSG